MQATHATSLRNSSWRPSTPLTPDTAAAMHSRLLCCSGILEGAKAKPRKFTETIELQIGLKNYDPQKDKRFSGTVKLPYIPRPKMKVRVDRAGARGVSMVWYNGPVVIGTCCSSIRTGGSQRLHRATGRSQVAGRSAGCVQLISSAIWRQLPTSTCDSTAVTGAAAPCHHTPSTSPLVIYTLLGCSYVTSCVCC